nr:hypothetical protein [Mycobacterium gordonae]
MQSTDRSLLLIINAIESNPHRPGADVDVTLHLPWGTVMGVIEPCWYFDQKVLGYLQTVGVDYNRQTSTDGTARTVRMGVTPTSTCTYPGLPAAAAAAKSICTISFACGCPTSLPGLSVAATVRT